MKAVRFHEYGGRDKLVVESVPDPVAGPGEVVVKVGACALNHLDVDFREGISRFPLELAADHGTRARRHDRERRAGRLGGVEGRRPRRAVPDGHRSRITSCRAPGRENLSPSSFIGASMPGGYAEYAAIPERHLVRTPDSMTDVEAAAFQIAFGTSYHMLFTRGELKMGETVLINSVGSGIGAAAVQLAHLAGAFVIGNASSDEKLAKARELGMHEGINHATHDVPTEVMRITNDRGVDLVYEHVGGKLFQAGLDSLTRDGRLVTCGAHSGEVVDLDIIVLFRNQTRIIGSFTFTSAEYEEVLRLAGLGLLKPQVHSTYSLDDAAEAFEVMEARAALRQDRDHAVSEPTASQTLATWVTDLRYSDIDAPTVAYAKELLLDHLGCAARGGTVDTADAVARMLADDRRRRGHGAHRGRRARRRCGRSGRPSRTACTRTRSSSTTRTARARCIPRS